MANSKYTSLPRAMQAYVAVVVTFGLTTIVQSLVDIVQDPKGWTWTILALLTLVSGSATVRLPSLPATISISETFVFTSVLLFGPAAGTITVALDAFVISFWTHKRGDPLYKVVFNVSAVPLAIWIAAHLFFLSAGIGPLASSSQPVAIRNLLLPLLLFTSAYFLLNSWIVAFAIALEKRLSAFRIWRDNIVWLSLNYFGGASVAALLVSYTRDLDFTYLAIIVPLLVVIYFTFSMSLGRVEDANRHLRQLNALYMSTIETLAMAIDAKDQITHGHIRRVQTYAIGLARGMGVSDEKLIRAVEAAALLHDMGKLAVPEYILNKPGPLTPAEFEKMKLHASVGADILSAIDFPYPVVPIVRHHHENWDGSGYPDKLAGPAIPLGARILSVVDCFDALTSDRPYRPRLSDRDALRVLQERRGTMYDPLVVDTFVRLHPTLVPSVEAAEASRPLTAITGAAFASPTGRSTRLEDITASAGEAVALVDMSRAVAGKLTVTEIGPILFGHIRRLVPHSVGVLFAYSEDTDELVASFVSSETASLFLGISLPLGQRLSGWVGANRQTIRNSDPVLDLGDVAKSLSPRLRSCLSTPLVSSSKLRGVLTLYSAQPAFFSEEHERIVETVASQVAPAVERAIAHDRTNCRPHRAQRLESMKDTESFAGLGENACLALIEVPREGSYSDPDLVAAALTELVRGRDTIFRRGARQVAVLFHESDKAYAKAVMERAFSSETGVIFAISSAPQEGRTVEQLAVAAEKLLRETDDTQDRSNRSIH